MNTIDTITLLNHLVVVSKNGESSLRAAAEEAHHADIRDSLYAYSRFFGDAARELQDAVQDLGGSPAGRGTFGNTLHRTWMHLKASALGRDEGVILDEVESDEAAAEARLAEAVHWDTPPEIHALLERQYEEAKRLHSTVHDLRTHISGASLH